MGDTTGGAWLGAPRDATLWNTYIYRYRWRKLAGGTSTCTMYRRDRQAGRQRPRQMKTIMVAANQQHLAIRGPTMPPVAGIDSIEK